MSTIITRDEAKQLINSVFATFAVSPSPDPIRDTAEAIRFKQGLATLADLHEKPDYKEALEALSMEGFTEYFNLIGDFWKLMGGDSAKKFTNVRLVSAKTLGEDIAKAQNAKKLSALVNGFNPQEITGLSYTEKLSAIKRILDDWFVLDDKENALLTLIGAMDENERATLQKDLLQGSNALLKKLLSKIDGPEKLSTYKLFATMLANNVATGEQIIIADGQRVHASFWKDTIKLTTYIDSQNLGSIKQKDYTVSPFSMIEYQLGSEKLRIPAFFFTDANTLAEFANEKGDGMGVINDKKIIINEKKSNQIKDAYIISTTYWGSLTMTTMSDLVAKNGVTHCNEFIPRFLNGLGEKVFKDIMPEGNVDANDLYKYWLTNPCLTNLNQIVANIDYEKPINIQEVAADLANDYANNNYLVLAAAKDGGGHVAVVAPQTQIFDCSPSLKDFNKSGKDEHQGRNKATVLRDYPVFLQAGTFTGRVPPGYAFNREMFDNNQVVFFVYKPTTE